MEDLVREYRLLLREGMKALPKETGKKRETEEKAEMTIGKKQVQAITALQLVRTYTLYKKIDESSWRRTNNWKNFVLQDTKTNGRK